jgi:putative ATP-dependent endonuclease of the OLD family
MERSQGLHLQRIAVTNHSRLADCEIDVREHLVVVGPNDVGKSSLLRLLDLLLGASVARLYADITPDDLRDPASNLVVQVTLVNLSVLEQALYPDEITVDPGDGSLSLTICLEVETDSDGTLDIRRTAPDSGHRRQLSREQQQGLGWRMIAATSRERELGDPRNTSLQGILADLDLGAEESELKELADEFQQKLGASLSLGELRLNLAKQLTRALPTKVSEHDLAFVSRCCGVGRCAQGCRAPRGSRGASEINRRTVGRHAGALRDGVIRPRSANMRTSSPSTSRRPISTRPASAALHDSSKAAAIKK